MFVFTYFSICFISLLASVSQSFPTSFINLGCCCVSSKLPAFSSVLIDRRTCTFPVLLIEKRWVSSKLFSFPWFLDFPLFHSSFSSCSAADSLIERATFLVLMTNLSSVFCCLVFYAYYLSLCVFSSLSFLLTSLSLSLSLIAALSECCIKPLSERTVYLSLFDMKVLTFCPHFSPTAADDGVAPRLVAITQTGRQLFCFCF